MISEFSEDLRKIFLAGLGAVAVTSEKSKQVVDELVKKGELTLEQGKVLNEELQHRVREKAREQSSKKNAETVAKTVEKLSPEQLEALKKKIAEVEAARQASGGKQEDAGK
ncbi:MAG TPA: aspartyl beta-hydroxylase [Ruminococcaceae bacterium]|jgi:polyhydroxyalkanoate synthesis regulator phasin|nr:aspartyl beta-hydroxylase [Oscillospiraceae bacterium]HBG55347.1 aspartyl beta-hydroxylase [Oscillospiraceae bacterium]HBQ47206.1 aspartyl beta-hydroxylase [Oscillospiraceae bacterium]HBT91329.1 aspartyl beta-hydroxylase [Oscillospiraceae bacterium]HCB91370.1 aspartyl beta-hydroxylase [Oscillospiraceae bacterium]